MFLKESDGINPSHFQIIVHLLVIFIRGLKTQMIFCLNTLFIFTFWSEALRDTPLFFLTSTMNIKCGGVKRVDNHKIDEAIIKILIYLPAACLNRKKFFPGPAYSNRL